MMPKPMLTVRKLTASQVEFQTSVEPDDTCVRGNLVASDEPDLDRADEDAVLARLERGEVEAWCGVVVTATWGSFEGRASLWGCSLDDTYTADVVAEEHGLREEALADLNAHIIASAAALAPVVDCS